MNYEVYTGFNPDLTADFFSKRGWPVSTIQRAEVELVEVQKGAALECGDGRFDQLENRKRRGIRILGGVNAIMAVLTGGNAVGLARATELLARFGATPGTHSADKGGCGFADLWIAGNLKEQEYYPYELGEALGAVQMNESGGEHFILNGNHQEIAVRLNPLKGLTEVANCGSRFRIDDWFMAGLGVPDFRRYYKIAETIEKLKPEAAILEIIIPSPIAA